jgi:hypothetical protein
MDRTAVRCSLIILVATAYRANHYEDSGETGFLLLQPLAAGITKM